MTVADKALRDNDEQEISLAELFNVLLQNVWLIVITFAVVLALGLAYAILATPVYKADALIQVEDQKSGAGLAGLSQLSEAFGVQQSSISGEIEILRSREVLLKAIETTGAAVNIQVDNHFPLIGSWMARRHEANSAELAEPLWGLSSYAWGGERLELAELALPRRAWGNDFYLEVTADGFSLMDEDDEVLLQDARLGQRLSFTIAGENAYLAVKSLTGRVGTRFLVQQASPILLFENLRAGLQVSEAGKQSQVIRLGFESTDRQFAADFVNAVARAYLEQNVERRSAEARTSLAFLEKQLPELKQNVEQKEEELTHFRTDSGTISIPEETQGLLEQAIALENRRLELQLKRDELRERYKPEHPMLKAITQQLAAVQNASAELGLNIDKLPEAQRDLLRLQRDAEVNTQLYISLLNNAQELRVAEAGTIGNVRIIDFAVLAERPVKPKRAMIVVMAALLGLMLGVIGAFLCRFLRPSVQRAEQIEQRLGLSTYVSVPESEVQKGFRIALPGRRNGKNNKHVLAIANPDDPAVESLRSLRTGLSFAMMGTKGKAIAITGATAGVGKSFVSANLAAVLASAGQRVVLLDVDLRRGRLHEYFGYERKRKGLSDVLSGGISLSDALVKVNDGLTVLPAGTVPPNPGELLLGSGLEQILKQLEADFDLVIADTAPLLPVADTLALMRHMDAAFMVVRAEHSTLAEIRDAVAKLRNAGVDTPLKGVIFNGVRRYRLGYGASYQYYYSYK
ncbi:polysaccharide biosynthesis tyrosine autokinase [Alcaligenaceae bacterium]|nr:polysaccharide biosynthesis tyrosine autokinase [Alcaligenaceae bacterium]